MKKIISSLLLGISFLTPTAYALSGTIKNGRYYSAEHLYSVAVPEIFTLVTKDIDNGNFHNVAFESGNGYWMMNGKYTVDFLFWPKKYREKPDSILMPLVSKAMIQILQSGELGNITQMSKPECHFLKVLGKQAYQCVYKFVAYDEKSLFVGTSIPFSEGLINAYGVESIARGKFNWDRYNSMLNSIIVYPLASSSQRIGHS
jgi:hypothetical protein